MKWAKDTLGKLRENKKQIKSFIKDSKSVYENLCLKCKRMVIVKTKAQSPVKERHYCEKCRKMFKDKFGDDYK